MARFSSLPSFRLRRSGQRSDCRKNIPIWPGWKRPDNNCRPLGQSSYYIAGNHIDLLTVVEQELGEIAGLEALIGRVVPSPMGLSSRLNLLAANQRNREEPG